MAYDKVAGVPADAATPSSKKKDKKVEEKGGGANPERGSGDETPSFWIKVSAA